MRPIRILPRADADVDEAAEYYSQKAGLEVALRFFSAVQQVYEFIRTNPEAGSPAQYERQRLAGMRRCLVSGFGNYLVFYRLSGEWVEIVRVLHGARDIEVLFETGE